MHNGSQESGWKNIRRSDCAAGKFQSHVAPLILGNRHAPMSSNQCTERGIWDKFTPEAAGDFLLEALYNHSIRFQRPFILCPTVFPKEGEMINLSRLRRIGLIILITLVGIGATQSVEGGFKEGAGAYKRGDYAAALKEFRISAEKGNPEAQFSLGRMYNKGEGVRRSHREAAKWFRRAAERGHPAAQLHLGVLYATGDGVIQNYVLAHMWFNLSSANGEKGAAQARERVVETMTSPQVAEAQRLAREFLAKKKK